MPNDMPMSTMLTIALEMNKTREEKEESCPVSPHGQSVLECFRCVCWYFGMLQCVLGTFRCVWGYSVAFWMCLRCYGDALVYFKVLENSLVCIGCVLGMFWYVLSIIQVPFLVFWFRAAMVEACQGYYSVCCDTRY